jgi:hypothetical protein
VWQTRDLLKSDAWRSMSAKARKVIDFLLIEQMSKGGAANGKLKAPHRQLCAFGIASYHVKAAIDECERLGLIDAQRGGMRVATTYALTWYPLHDGTPANNRWREFKAENQKSASRITGRAASEITGRLGKSASKITGRLPQNPASKIADAFKNTLTRAEDLSSGLSVGAERQSLSVLSGGRA